MSLLCSTWSCPCKWLIKILLLLSWNHDILFFPEKKTQKKYRKYKKYRHFNRPEKKFYQKFVFFRSMGSMKLLKEKTTFRQELFNIYLKHDCWTMNKFLFQLLANIRSLKAPTPILEPLQQRIEEKRPCNYRITVYVNQLV